MADGINVADKIIRFQLYSFRLYVQSYCIYHNGPSSMKSLNLLIDNIHKKTKGYSLTYWDRHRVIVNSMCSFTCTVFAFVGIHCICRIFIVHLVFIAKVGVYCIGLCGCLFLHMVVYCICVCQLYK